VALAAVWLLHRWLTEPCAGSSCACCFLLPLLTCLPRLPSPNTRLPTLLPPCPPARIDEVYDGDIDLRHSLWDFVSLYTGGRGAVTGCWLLAGLG
jgi:hypothetical protein